MSKTKYQLSGILCLLPSSVRQYRRETAVYGSQLICPEKLEKADNVVKVTDICKADSEGCYLLCLNKKILSIQTLLETSGLQA